MAKDFANGVSFADAQRLILESTGVSQVSVLNTKEADVTYLWSREKKPMCRECWFLNPTVEAGWAEKINKITRLQDLCI